MTLKVEPIKSDFVAEVGGIDLAKPLGDHVVQELRETIARYGVLLFRDQALSQIELVEFGARFGPLDTKSQAAFMDRLQKRLTHAALSDVSNIDAATGKVADRNHEQSIFNVGNQFWHSDSSYSHAPFRYSFLECVHAPSWGGATQFADLRAAYDALDERTRALIVDKSAVFYSQTARHAISIPEVPDSKGAFRAVRWPMVRTHPESGRKVLWVDTKVCKVDGMSIPEGRALVQELVEHTGQRERVFTQQWQPGDVVMYDNRSVLHRGRRFDLSERREMRRVAVLETENFSLGEVPFDELPVSLVA